MRRKEVEDLSLNLWIHKNLALKVCQTSKSLTLMDPQEPGAQSVPDIQQIEVERTDAAAQGTSPDKAANTDEQTDPDATAIPDEGANPDKGSTPDGKSHTDEATITGAASTAVEEATQEPFTQSVKEGQAPQEPHAQRVGESLLEAESGMFLTYLHSISRIIC